ncbi:electron transfer flavoprotein subunit alpha, partial [Streptomyces sp. SID625]|nr:electron transfer flavoprotein subunit alpha [Streptomyces sp. SID625]
GWLEYARQIGTTGVTVDPDLYVAFGISGAPHHTGGLGAPRHVVSVNTDPYCPMTAMADLGIVADAPAVLAALLRKVREESGDADELPAESGEVRDAA